jgi:hypothetical protein
MIVGLASVSQGGCGGTLRLNQAPPDSEVSEDQDRTASKKKLTMFFEGLIAYVQDADGDGVTVLLVDSRTERPDGAGVPAHIPLMTLDSSGGNDATIEVPMVLDREDIVIELNPQPAKLHLDVDDDVWEGTASLSKLTGSVVRPEMLKLTNDPKEVVARVRLEHGKLEVDRRSGGVLQGPVKFKPANGDEHKTYKTKEAALLYKYTVNADDIVVKTYPIGKINDAPPNRVFDLSTLSMRNLRVTVGNIAAKYHGDQKTDHHFVRLYDLVYPYPPSQKLFLPRFPDPRDEEGPGGVGTRACMGGGG